MNSQAWQPATGVDRGEADADLRRALSTAYDDIEGYLDAIARLCTARLIMPTVEAPEDAEPGVSKRTGEDPGHDHGDDHDHEHEEGAGHRPRAAVLLRSSTGEKGVLAFTGMDALRSWNPGAHPVRCTLDDVAATVAETESSTIVIDVAGPHQLVIGADAIAQLAQGRRLVRLDDGGFGWMFLAEGEPGSSERDA